MRKLQLDREWSVLMDKYDQDHQDPRNQFCHKVGIPMIAASFPVGATVVGLPLAATMFTVGWGFQFVGHAYEGKQPTFVSDKRGLLAGLLWWTKKMGWELVQTTPLDEPAAETTTVTTAPVGHA